MANNRICLTCGKSYEYCGSCNSSLKYPVWMSIFYTENCKNIFEVVSDYKQKTITKKRAIERLEKCDLTNRNYLKENMREIIDELFPIEVTNIEKNNETPVKQTRKRKAEVSIDAIEKIVNDI